MCYRIPLPPISREKGRTSVCTGWRVSNPARIGFSIAFAGGVASFARNGKAEDEGELDVGLAVAVAIELELIEVLVVARRSFPNSSGARTPSSAFIFSRFRPCVLAP